MESLNSLQPSLGSEPQDSISFSELSKYFHVPLVDAAKTIGVCPTALKRACRKNNVPRWPHRKIKSLDKAIENTRAELQTAEEELLREKLNFDLLYLQQQRDFVMRGNYGNSGSAKHAKRTAKTPKKSRSFSFPQLEKEFKGTARSESDSEDSSLDDEPVSSGDDKSPQPGRRKSLNFAFHSSSPSSGLPLLFSNSSRSINSDDLQQPLATTSPRRGPTMRFQLSDSSSEGAKIFPTIERKSSSPSLPSVGFLSLYSKFPVSTPSENAFPRNCVPQHFQSPSLKRDWKFEEFHVSRRTIPAEETQNARNPSKLSFIVNTNTGPEGEGKPSSVSPQMTEVEGGRLPPMDVEQEFRWFSKHNANLFSNPPTTTASFGNNLAGFLRESPSEFCAEKGHPTTFFSESSSSNGIAHSTSPFNSTSPFRGSCEVPQSWMAYEQQNSLRRRSPPPFFLF